MRRLTLAIALLSGCQEYEIRAGAAGQVTAPDIEVDPLALTFGPATSGETLVQSFVVKNVGAEALDVSALELASGATGFSVLTAAPFEVLAGEEQVVELAFTPPGELTFGELLIHSDDPDEAVVSVALQGLGQVPALEISPAWHVFATACDDQVELTLTNAGLETLRIDDIRYDTVSPDLWLEDANALPLELAPGAWTSVRVHYTPTSASATLGELQVDSNDPRGTRTAEQSAEGASGPVTETFEVTADPPIDILFAIDRSGSMSDDARALGNAFEDFIQEIDLVTTDWRIGVVTKDDGCFNRGIISAATPDYQNVFLDAVSGGLGIFGYDNTEALLELIDNALRATGPGGCNAGFVRGNAVLHIVAISDEPEQSGQPADYWVARYQANMTDPNLVIVSTVADVNAACGSGAAGYVEAADLTGGLKLNICSSNWSTFASTLGAASAATLQTWLLSATPDETTITVTVDGVAYPTGWTYDPARNAIVITADLPVGAEVAVSYTAIGC